MELTHNLTRIDKRWAAANGCSLIIGTIVRAMLSNPSGVTPLNGLQYSHLVSQLIHILFNPIAYCVAALLLVFRVVQLRCIGFWSILFSFVIGGLLTSSVVTLVSPY